jgi:SAM-dependent methyltransferase
MELQHRACPLCGASDVRREVAAAHIAAERLDSYSFASRKAPERMHWRFVECASCSLVYAQETPPDEWFLDQYREAAYDSGAEARDAAATYASLLSRFAARLPGREGAIDIGAGDGAFLEKLLEAGFTDVRGFEPSAAPRSAAAAHVAPLIAAQPFTADAVEAGSCSLVSCLHTIEHVPNPAALCADVAQALRPGGAFFVVCHDVCALSARVLGARSPIFDVEHFQLYSRRTLSRQLSQAGFDRIVVHSFRNTYPLRYWLRLAPLTPSLKRLPERLGAVRLTLPAGNLWAVGFRAS